MLFLQWQSALRGDVLLFKKQWPRFITIRTIQRCQSNVLSELMHNTPTTILACNNGFIHVFESLASTVSF